MMNFPDCPENKNYLLNTKSITYGDYPTGCFKNYSKSPPKTVQSIISYCKDFHDKPELFDQGVSRNLKEIWGTDQNMVSIRIKQFALRYGAGKVKMQHETKEFKRLDRNELTWWNKIDHYGTEMLKDSHFLQATYRLDSWWKARYLFDLMFSESEIANLTEYRLNFVHEFYENHFDSRGKVDGYGSISGLNKDQDLVELHLEHYVGEDMNKVWTEYFPRVYFNLMNDNMKSLQSEKRGIASGHMRFDPEHERIFKEENGKIYVVPKLNRPYITLERQIGDQIIKLPVFCEKPCKEIIFKK